MAEVKVWTVWIRDPWTGTDKECVVATTSRIELHAVLVRCDLRRRDAHIVRRKVGDDGSARVGTYPWLIGRRSHEAWRPASAFVPSQPRWAARTAPSPAR